MQTGAADLTLSTNLAAELILIDVPLEDGVDAWPPDGTAPDGLQAP